MKTTLVTLFTIACLLPLTSGCSGSKRTLTNSGTVPPTVGNQPLLVAPDTLTCQLTGLGSQIRVNRTSGVIDFSAEYTVEAKASLGSQSVPARFQALTVPNTTTLLNSVPSSTSQVRFKVGELGTLTLNAQVSSSATSQTANCQLSVQVVADDVSLPGVTLGIAPVHQAYPPGGSLSLSWQATAVSNCILKKNGTAISVPGNTYIIPSTQPSDSGIYSIDCVSSSGFIVSDVKQITIDPYPTLVFTKGLASGGVVPLSWQASYVQTCSLTDSVSNTVHSTATTGTFSAPITANQVTYTLRCLNPYGRDGEKSIDVFPATMVPMETTLISSASTAPYQGTVTLTTACSHPLASKRLTLLRNGTETVLANANTVVTPPLLQGSNLITLTCSLANANSVNSLVIQVAAPTDHMMFVSRATYTGKFVLPTNNAVGAGVYAADSKCEMAARAQGLRNDRPWKAVMASDKLHATDHVYISGDVYMPNISGSPTRVAVASAFWQGSWESSVNRFEDGIANTAPHLYVWTGFDPSKLHDDSVYDCGKWSYQSGINALIGNASSSDSQRFNANVTAPFKNCSNSYHLYCISQ